MRWERGNNFRTKLIPYAAAKIRNVVLVINQKTGGIVLVKNGGIAFSSPKLLTATVGNPFDAYYIPFYAQSPLKKHSPTSGRGRRIYEFHIFVVPYGRIVKLSFFEAGSNTLVPLDNKLIANDCPIDPTYGQELSCTFHNAHLHAWGMSSSTGQATLAMLSLHRVGMRDRYKFHVWTEENGWYHVPRVTEKFDTVTPTNNSCANSPKDVYIVDYTSLNPLTREVQIVRVGVVGTAVGEDVITKSVGPSFNCTVAERRANRNVVAIPTIGSTEYGSIQIEEGPLLQIVKPIPSEGEEIDLLCRVTTNFSSQDGLNNTYLALKNCFRSEARLQNLLLCEVPTAVYGDTLGPTACVLLAPEPILYRSEERLKKKYHRLKRYLVRHCGFVGGGRNKASFTTLLTEDQIKQLHRETSVLLPGRLARLTFDKQGDDIHVHFVAEGTIASKCVPLSKWKSVFVDRHDTNVTGEYKDFISIVESVSVDPSLVK